MEKECRKLITLPELELSNKNDYSVLISQLPAVKNVRMSTGKSNKMFKPVCKLFFLTGITLEIQSPVAAHYVNKVEVTVG